MTMLLLCVSTGDTTGEVIPPYLLCMREYGTIGKDTAMEDVAMVEVKVLITKQTTQRPTTEE